MPFREFEKRELRALMHAALPAPVEGLPTVAALADGAFFDVFAASASPGIRVALRAAGVALGYALPRARGHRGTFSTLAPAEQESLLIEADAHPMLTELLKVVKLAAAFAYFDDDRVQGHFRRGGLGGEA